MGESCSHEEKTSLGDHSVVRNCRGRFASGHHGVVEPRFEGAILWNDGCIRKSKKRDAEHAECDLGTGSGEARIGRPWTCNFCGKRRCAESVAGRAACDARRGIFHERRGLPETCRSERVKAVEYKCRALLLFCDEWTHQMKNVGLIVYMSRK